MKYEIIFESIEIDGPVCICSVNTMKDAKYIVKMHRNVFTMYLEKSQRQYQIADFKAGKGFMVLKGDRFFANVRIEHCGIVK